MNYEWTFIIHGKKNAWRKAKTEKSAFRAAMKLAREFYPDATSKGYTRTIFLEDGSQKIDFGHWSVFIEIRKIKNEKHKQIQDTAR